MRAGLAVAALLALGASPVRADDWPGFLGPNRDGKSAETGLDWQWPRQGPPVVWQRERGEGYAAPAVVQGLVLSFDRVDGRERISALRVADGELLWQHADQVDYEDYYGYSAGPRAAPLVDSGRVYTMGVAGDLRCRRLADGELLWQVDTEAEFGVVQNFFGVGASPAVFEDLVIAMVGGSPPGSPTIHRGALAGNGSAIVAFDKRTGRVRYRFGDELASYASPVLRRIGGRWWGFQFARGGLLAFDPLAGRELAHFPWRARRLESVNAATPVVVENEILITESYGPGAALLRLDVGGDDRAASLEVVWKDGPREQAMAAHWATPIHHRGFLYGSSGEKSGSAELRCVEWGRGEVRWSEPGLRRSTLLYADDHLAVLSEQGELLALRATPERFDVVSRTTPSDAAGRPLLRYPVWTPPALSDGVLYVVSDGGLTAFDLRPSGEAATGGDGVVVPGERGP